MISIIITGANGQLGREFIHHLPFTEGYSVYTFDRHQLDIADREKIVHILETLPAAGYWINCAAYTRVDDAEIYPREAELSNALGPGFMAQACAARHVHFFHFSSDYVYHNDLRRPLRENDPLEPKGVYAKTKRDGEQEIADAGGSYTIIRTSWVYGAEGHNFVNTMLRLGKIKEELSIVGDQLGAPTYTYDIAAAVKKMIRLCEAESNGKIQGVFNFANAGEVTWDDFAREIFRLSGSACQVKTITTEEYGAPAPRPAYSVLDCTRLSTLISSKIPTWQDALTRYLASIHALQT